MDLKSRKTPKKTLNKSCSSSSLPKKRTTLSKQHSNKKSNVQSKLNIHHLQARKKPDSAPLVKKKIEQLRSPQLLIKINYKGKRLSIPLYSIEEKSLKEIVLPHILKFQKDILRNAEFNPSQIANWKSSGNPDILKDYYFQTDKPLSVFKGQILYVEPIWKKPGTVKVSLSDFEIIKCIGTGGFSRVFLVRLNSTGKFYALKLMEKEGLLESGKECVVINERDIMVNLDDDYALKLEFAFETKHFVALALEYCPGGELFYYLRKVRRMNEDEARFCFIQVLLGIQYLHSKKIIYRDIKPENIMIDAQGNLKIADFGLSKIGLKPSELGYTYCGSPQYMAPQMLNKSGHNYSIDYYCLGALLYELVTGNPPFYSRNVEKIYHSIQNQDIDFPPHIDLSPELKMLLQGLLSKDPNRRLGSLGGVREILGHPWVRKLKTTDVIQKKVKTPIQVDLLTFNINEQEVEEGQNNFGIKLQDQGADFEPMFEDFYFARDQPINVLDQYFHSAKSDSTKQNKSANLQVKGSKDRAQSRGSSKERKNQNNLVSVKAHMKSDSRPYLQSSKHKLKKKHRKQPILVERGKRRDVRQKSFNKADKRMASPKPPKRNTLKRIKSSTALLGNETFTKRIQRN